jgi:hypothetical protein
MRHVPLVCLALALTSAEIAHAHGATVRMSNDVKTHTRRTQ